MRDPTTIVGITASLAERTPDKEFCRHRSATGAVATLTYGELWRQMCGVAADYVRYSSGRGTVVPIVMASSPVLYSAFLGVMLGGGIPTIFPPFSRRQNPEVFWRSQASVFARLNPDVIFADPANAQGLRASLPDLAGRIQELIKPAGNDSAPVSRSSQDVAVLQHSSGTTGLKKGVVLTHEAIIRHCENYARAIDFSPDDRVASWLPLYHDMGLISSFLLPLLRGASISGLDPFEWTVRPATLLETITQDSATLTWLPNFAFNHLVRATPKDRSFDLSGMRAWINCSEPCKASTFERFLARFGVMGVREEHLQVCYAMAENVFAVTQTALGQPVTRRMSEAGERLSCGAPIDGASVRIDHGPGGASLAEAGEIVIGGETLFSGYWGRSATDSRLRNGEYWSRDLGIFHDGELYLAGRMDDLLIIHGKNLYAHDIEDAINENADIKPGRVVAIGVPNEQVGSEDLVVIAEQNHELSDEERFELIKTIKAAVSVETGVAPNHVMIVASGWLIKTTSGKISREENKKRFLEKDS